MGYKNSSYIQLLFPDNDQSGEIQSEVYRVRLTVLTSGNLQYCKKIICLSFFISLSLKVNFLEVQ